MASSLDCKKGVMYILQRLGSIPAFLMKQQVALILVLEEARGSVSESHWVLRTCPLTYFRDPSA